MPYQSRHASSLADLILRQGDIASDRAARSGAMWADVVRGAAGIPAGIQQRNAALAEAYEKQRDRDLARRNTESQIAERHAGIEDRGNQRTDAEAAKELALSTQKTMAWLGDIASAPDAESKKMAYKVGRDALVKEGRLSPAEAPDFFPGDSWVKARATQLLPYAERFKAMFPEPKAPIEVSAGATLFDQERGASVFTAPTAPREPSNPTEASLAAAAAAGDANAAKALQLLREQRPQPTGPSTETGWTLQTVTDPNTNQTRMVRVNSRTGEVQPVALPEGMQPGGQRTPRLTAGQQEDLATMKTVGDLIGIVHTAGDEIGWKGVGALGAGTVSKVAMNLGWGTEKEEQLRNHISNIQATIAKLRGGTSFTVNEQKLLEQYTPTINDGDATIKAKLKSLKQFIELKRANTLEFAGAVPKDNDRDPLGLGF